MKKRSLLFLLSTYLFFTHSLYAQVDSLVIPEIEHAENITDLPVAKYSKRQYEGIVKALNQGSERIRLVTYNVLFNCFDQSLDEINRWPQRIPRILELLAKVDPDILSVQELLEDQAVDLMKHLGDTYELYTKPGSDKECTGILYRKDRFRILDRHVWYMTEAPEQIGPNTLTMLKLLDLRSGKEFIIYNTHLAFSKINNRDFQARFIAEKIQPMAKKTPLIFTGDLNTFPNRLDLPNLPAYDGDYVLQILQGDSLKKAQDVALLGHLGPIATFTNREGGFKPFEGTGTPGVILDNILVSEDIVVLIHAVLPETVNGHFPSDHMPVLIDFLVKAEQGASFESKVIPVLP